jgi:hypothetical protein
MWCKKWSASMQQRGCWSDDMAEEVFGGVVGMVKGAEGGS